MLPELGHFLVIIALVLALIQSIAPLIGIRTQQPRLQNMVFSLSYGQCFFIGGAFILLAFSFLNNDFSVAYVFENSNAQLPWLYRLCAVWGGHEGSMLLWVTVLSLWMAAVAQFSKSLPLDFVARVLSIMAMISFGFLLFILQTSDPFARLLPEIPLIGQDLNPLLQDPGLVTHPPMLYMGYVGFSVAFAFAIAALQSGRLDSQWAKWTRPWTVAAWCFLTLGITLGSWWSYRVLGWGGWWFWDPVENASFMPWLVGTALIHSLMVTEKRGAFKSWTVLLAILAFSLSLIGTFLVRSGILNSVHAFAVDPARGAYILKFLVVVIGSSLFLYAWKMSSLSSSTRFSLLSRESFIFLNNIFLVTAAFTVLLGTLYPLLLDALGFAKISVGTPYFNAVFIPLTIPFLFLMGIGPRLLWKENQFDILKSLGVCFMLSVILALIFPLLLLNKISFILFIGLALSFWILITTGQSFYFRFMSLRQNKQSWSSLPRSFIGMIVAHSGLAATIIGITLSTQLGIEKDVRMSIGDSVALNNYTFIFRDSSASTGANYQSIRGTFDVFQNHRSGPSLFPEKRLFTQDKTSTSVPSIDSTVFRDLYVVLAEPLGNASWAVRIYDKPFIRWIWLGGLMMVFGGILAASEKRFRSIKTQTAKFI
jgi:cytochrome c-type biogenesis protein CcmF